MGTSLFIGAPFWWGSPAWRSAYVAPPVIFHQTPSVYILPPAPGPVYWYYCHTAHAYYPYVKDCPEGWTPVAPTRPAE